MFMITNQGSKWKLCSDVNGRIRCCRCKSLQLRLRSDPLSPPLRCSWGPLWVRGQSRVKAERNLLRSCLLSSKPLPPASLSLWRGWSKSRARSEDSTHWGGLVRMNTDIPLSFPVRFPWQNLRVHGPQCAYMCAAVNKPASSHTRSCAPASAVQFGARLNAVALGGWKRMLIEFIEASEHANDPRLRLVMREVEPNWAELPVSSDENQTIKGFCSHHRSFLSFCGTSSVRGSSHTSVNKLRALKLLNLPLNCSRTNDEYRHGNKSTKMGENINHHQLQDGRWPLTSQLLCSS